MLDWIAALVVLLAGGWGIRQFVRYNLRDYEEWARQERYRYMMEMEEQSEPWDISS
jgi:hypothetical protein